MARCTFSFIFLLLHFFLLQLTVTTAAARQNPGTVQRAQHQTIEELLLQIYDEREREPLWVNLKGPTARAEVLLQTLKAADLEGLNPADYRVTALTALWQDHSMKGLARLEVLLSQALVRYVIDQHRGISGAAPSDPENNREKELTALLREGLTAEDITAFLKQQSPQHKAYIGLKKALATYRNLNDQGGWEPIAPGPPLKPGHQDPRLADIARRLILTGDLRSETPISTLTYGPALVMAVKHFQMRHNLAITGVVDDATLTAMNLPAPEIIRRILVNMERWRWLPRKMDGRRILVNITGFKLTVTEDETVQMTMPVIVGELENATPVLSDRVRYIVLNPFWTIPPDIAERETLPCQLADPNYLRTNNIRVFESWQAEAEELEPEFIDWKRLGAGIRYFRLRQDPGPNNTLGQVKFMFPNKKNIYLHDTPAHDLFTRSTRTFSHGCIRLSKPVSLAAYLLQDNRRPLDESALQQIIASGERRVVHLDTPVPVHLTYQTVEADPASGQLSFHKDIYDQDLGLAEALHSTRQNRRVTLPSSPINVQQRLKRPQKT